MKVFKKSLLGLSLTSLLLMANSAYADRIADDVSKIDVQTALSKFSSVNQLGELSLNIPTSEYFNTKNGVPVIFTPMHNLPIVDIDLDFKGGNLHDDKIRAGAEGGIAAMTASMMTQGTVRLDEEAFAEQSEQLAMQLSVGTGAENFNFSLRALKQDNIIDEAVDLMMDAYANPRFDETILARNKAQLAVALRAKESSPAFLAKRAFDGIMDYNNPNAYDNAIEKINQINRDELFAFKNQFLVADNARLAIAGDLSLDEAKMLANKIARHLPKGEKAAQIKAHTKPAVVHHHIDFPSTQTHIIIGGISPAPVPNKTKDEIQTYHDYTLGNAVLAGGDFNARLMQAIRVKGGYTYGISGGMTYNSQQGVYSIDFSTKNEDATNAIADTLATIDEVLKNGIRQDELDLEKTGVKNAYPTRFGSHSGVHNSVSSVFFDEYPKDHLQTRFDRLDNATLEKVNAALRQFVRPEQFVVVTVGASKPTVVLPTAHQSSGK